MLFGLYRKLRLGDCLLGGLHVFADGAELTDDGIVSLGEAGEGPPRAVKECPEMSPLGLISQLAWAILQTANQTLEFVQ